MAAKRAKAKAVTDYLQAAKPRDKKQSVIERDTPEVAEALRQFAEAKRAGQTRISIAQFYDEFLVPLGCHVTVSCVRDYIKERCRDGS